MNNRMRTALIALISVVWAANFITPIFEKNFKPPAEINLAFMGVVGILTATYDKNKKDDNKPSGGGTT